MKELVRSVEVVAGTPGAMLAGSCPYGVLLTRTPFSTSVVMCARSFCRSVGCCVSV